MRINLMPVVLMMIALQVSLSWSSFAQKEDEKTKKLRSKWEDKKKEMSLPEFKTMMEEREVLRGEVEGLKRSLANMSTDISDRDAEVARLKAEIDSTKLSSGMRLVEKNEIDVTKKKGYDKGLVFKVQAGAYSKIDFSKFDGNNKNFSIEKEGDVIKYVLGYFRNLEEAKNFMRYMRTVGVSDAWIVAYKDNTRLDVEEQKKYNSD